jgi:hypothetical protein
LHRMWSDPLTAEGTEGGSMTRRSVGGMRS